MSNVKQQLAKELLAIKAIKLQPQAPFTWASGWKSPFYCDNRKTLSYPALRTYIKEEFVKLVKSNFPDAEVVAGVATGAIAQGALVADALGLPFVYVRSSQKDHGLGNLVELLGKFRLLSCRVSHFLSGSDNVNLLFHYELKLVKCVSGERVCAKKNDISCTWLDDVFSSLDLNVRSVASFGLDVVVHGSSDLLASSGNTYNVNTFLSKKHVSHSAAHSAKAPDNYFYIFHCFSLLF